MSTTDTDSLLPAELAERMGQWGEWKSAYPISTADIQRWAINAYWPEEPPRLYWDAEYAETTRWKGIVAPQEFNPFAWTMDSQYPRAVEQPAAGAVLKRNGFQVLNGGQADEFGEMMRPGDVIRSRSRLSEWTQKTTRFGPTLFVTSEELWVNQRDEMVRRRLSTSAAYLSGGES
jgi:hypothetical protein